MSDGSWGLLDKVANFFVGVWAKMFEEGKSWAIWFAGAAAVLCTWISTQIDWGSSWFSWLSSHASTVWALEPVVVLHSWPYFALINTFIPLDAMFTGVCLLASTWVWCLGLKTVRWALTKTHLWG